MRIISILVFLLVLTGCVAAVDTIKTDGVQATAADRGFVLIGIDSNQQLNEVHIRGPKNIKLTQADMPEGGNYLLFELPAGSYQISYISLGYAYGWVLDDDELWAVNIKPKAINYIGDLSVKQQSQFSPYADIQLRNRASIAYSYMRARFPVTLENNSLHYSGPGADFFLSHIQQGASE